MEVESIQTDSYPGAKLTHLHNILETHNSTNQTPDTLILSIGINNKENKTTTHRQNLRKLATIASQKFPSTQVCIPQVNYSESLPEAQKQSLSAFNTIVRALTDSHDNLCTIPPLTSEEFKTCPDNIHWTPETANKMLAHWTKHLN